MKKYNFLVFSFILFFLGTDLLAKPSDNIEPLKKNLNAPAQKVYDAAIHLLEKEGFKVELKDFNQGLIQTSIFNLDEQTAFALFDKPLKECEIKEFALKIKVLPIISGQTSVQIFVVSNEKTNGFLEQTYMNRISEILGIDLSEEQPTTKIEDVPFVRVSLNDDTQIEGYLIDDSNKDFLKLKLKSGGIFHVMRDDIFKFVLSQEATLFNN